MMVVFFLSLVAFLGKYAFRIQNLYQFIDCKKTVLRWHTGEVDMVEDNEEIRFHTGSSQLNKQVSNSTGWA